MDFPDDLRLAEESLKQAEKEFLAGSDGIAEALLEKLSEGTFSSYANTARERMQNLDESRYVKWDRWDKKYEFSASFWKDCNMRRARSPSRKTRPRWPRRTDAG